MSSPLNELYGVVCTSSTSCVARFWTIPSAPIGQFLVATDTSGSRRKPRGCRATSETSGVARLRHTEPSEGSRDRVAAHQRYVS